MCQRASEKGISMRLLLITNFLWPDLRLGLAYWQRLLVWPSFIRGCGYFSTSASGVCCHYDCPLVAHDTGSRTNTIQYGFEQLGGLDRIEKQDQVSRRESEVSYIRPTRSGREKWYERLQVHEDTIGDVWWCCSIRLSTHQSRGQKQQPRSFYDALFDILSSMVQRPWLWRWRWRWIGGRFRRSACGNYQIVQATHSNDSICNTREFWARWRIWRCILGRLEGIRWQGKNSRGHGKIQCSVRRVNKINSNGPDPDYDRKPDIWFVTQGR